MAANPEQSLILSFEAARKVVEHHAGSLRPRGRELLGLLDSRSHVLAEAIDADRDSPPFPRSTRDGYALRASDLEHIPAELALIGEVRAGAADTVTLNPGQAIAIMTGAAVPEGADAVIMIEQTTRSGGRVQIRRRVSAGENIVPVGAEGKRGDQLLAPGSRMDYAGIALAASAGRSRVLVYAMPKVAVLSTGDEVVDVDMPPAKHQIRNSNSYSLAAQIQAAGGEPVLLPIAPDETGRLRDLLAEGFEADLLLIAGGVSMGEYDLVERVLVDMKAEFFFTGAEIQPGKPVIFGRVPQSGSFKYFFGLPGNPISTMVTFELFARPLLETLAGVVPRNLSFTHARLKSEIRTRTGLKRFLPGMLSGEFENSQVELVKWQGSGDIGAVTRANCFVVIPPDRDRIAAGEWIPVLLR